MEGVKRYVRGRTLGCVTIGGDQRDLLLWLACVELKSLERRALRDDLDHWSYFNVDRTDSRRI